MALPAAWIEPLVYAGIVLAALAVLARIRQLHPELLRQRAAQGVLGFFVLALVQGLLVLHAVVFDPSTAAIAAANYGFAIEIGLLVGGTEMISRYRDDPFAPLVSTPGLFYVLINGGAAALAYYLMVPLKVDLPEPLKTLTAGFGAMAFFRSSVFTARVGKTDIPVGPSLVLQVVLDALDRTYDRQRAVPRSNAVVEIMRSVPFDEVKEALPALSFSLMQNVTEKEVADIKQQVADLSAASMPDETKILTLGLALINVVGEETLRAAVKALGNDAKGFRGVSPQLLMDLAAVDPGLVTTTLPKVCAELPPEIEGHAPPDFTTEHPNLTEESGAVLMLYKLVAHYGEPRVKVAIGVLAAQG